MLLKNKRHLGFGTSVRSTRGLRPEDGHHHPALTGLKGDGRYIHMTGILSYSNGVAEFDARLTDDEETELLRLFTCVADRVHALLIDNKDRRGHSRNARSLGR